MNCFFTIKIIKISVIKMLAQPSKHIFDNFLVLYMYVLNFALLTFSLNMDFIYNLMNIEWQGLSKPFQDTLLMR